MSQVTNYMNKELQARKRKIRHYYVMKKEELCEILGIEYRPLTVKKPTPVTIRCVKNDETTHFPREERNGDGEEYRVSYLVRKDLNVFRRLSDREVRDRKRSLLDKHIELCQTHEYQHAIYPDPNTGLNFGLRRWCGTMEIPFCVTADLECFLRPIAYAENALDKSFTVGYQEHVPSGFCYILKYENDDTFGPKTVMHTMENEGDDVGKKFVESLTELANEIYKVLGDNKPMGMRDEEIDNTQQDNEVLRV